MANEHIVIAGGGLAAATAARTLRSEGFDGDVTVLCKEYHYPYLRPPLSKGFLLGTEDQDAVPVLPRDWYADHQVDLRLGAAVTGVDVAGQSAELSSGSRITYSRMLLATGSVPRRPALPGSELNGVMTFRTLDDCLRLKDLLSHGGRDVVLVGGGWIAMELAAAAKTLGNNATVLARGPVPLASAVGPDIGSFLRRVHESKGVRFVQGHADRILDSAGSAAGVLTDSGDELPADVVILAVGAAPDTQLASDAGLDVDNGVLTDASLRTSAPHIFAAGDIANALHPLTGQRYRNEHWNNALTGGKTAAKAMLGHDVRHDAVPYFYTDQFEVSLEYSGFPNLAESRPVFRGDPDSGEFLAFWLREGVMVAGVSVNVPKVHKAIKALISGRVALDESRLRDLEGPLDQLLPAA